jgi:hypothetical protein
LTAIVLRNHPLKNNQNSVNLVDNKELLLKTGEIVSFAYSNKLIKPVASFEGKIALLSSIIGAGIVAPQLLLAATSVALGFLVKKQFDSLSSKRDELSFKLSLKNIFESCQTKEDFYKLSEEKQTTLIQFKNLLFHLVEIPNPDITIEPYCSLSYEMLKRYKELFVVIQQIENNNTKENIMNPVPKSNFHT